MRTVGQLLALVAVGCTGPKAPPPVPVAPPSAAAAPVAKAPPAPAPSSAANTAAVPVPPPAAWVSFADGKLHMAPEKPTGLYVGGAMVNGAFQPASGVQGEGAIGAPGQPGWFDLKGSGFHSDVEAKAPIKAYVKGARAADGSFSPATRDVTY